MNLLKLLICLISLITFDVNAQLLFSPEKIFEQFPVFNSSYIQSKKIKSITFNIIDKKDWQVAEDKNLVEVYEFYPDGKLKRQYSTAIKKVIQFETHSKKNKSIITKEIYEYDTLSTEYIYQQNQIIERYFYPNGYTEATYYTICKNHICKEEKYIETYRTLSSGSKILDKLLLKAYDSIASYEFNNQIKKVYYNNEKLPYKEKFIYFDKNKKINEIIEQFTVANGRIKKTFQYLPDGNIASALMTIDYGSPETYYIEYQYDNYHQPLSEKHFKNEQSIKEYQYIYSENKNELKSILIRTFDDKNIRIIKLNYEYY